MMLWLLCLPFTKCLPGVQCLFVLLMPFLGSMFGPDVVIRLSAILLLHALITGAIPVGTDSHIPRGTTAVLAVGHPSFQRGIAAISWGTTAMAVGAVGYFEPWINDDKTKHIPFFSTGLMVAMVAVPLDLVPGALIWAYGHLLWVSEPLLMMIEAVAMVHFTVLSSKAVVGYIDDNPIPVKSAILGVTAVSYVAAVCLGVVLWLTGGSSVRLVLGVLALTSVVLLVTTVTVDRGVISDCAVVSLYLVWCIWVMQQENKLSAHPLKPPITWEKGTKTTHSSLVQVLYSIYDIQLGNLSSFLSFLWALFSPTTLVMVLTRSLVISKAGLILKKISTLILGAVLAEGEDDDDEWESDDEDDPASSRTCCSALYPKSSQSQLLKLAFLFVYTQLIVYNIEASVHPMEALVPSIDIDKDLRTSRLLQVGLAGGFYLWTLMQKAEDEDEDWY